MITLIIFIAVLSVLVFVHEFGHFVMAKRAGMKVEEFGFGFPPRLFGIKRGETEYSINWIPFGGFVKILGEDGEQKDNPRSFAFAGIRVRSGVVIAGVIMNFLLAVVLLTIVNATGLRIGLANDQIGQNVRNIKVQIIQIVPGSPASLAGLKPLDEIVGFEIGNQKYPTVTVEKVQALVNENRGREIIVDIQNGNSIDKIKIVPRQNPPPGEGALGVSLALTGLVRYPWYQAIERGVVDSAMILEQTVIGYATIIKNAVLTGKAGTELSGPVGIAVITGQAAKLGLTYLLQFVALISINLAILNIIPFPALDGGRLLFIIIEKIKGKPVHKKIENAVNSVGFALLILLMIYVTTKDIIKFL